MRTRGGKRLLRYLFPDESGKVMDTTEKRPAGAANTGRATPAIQQKG